MPSLLRHRSTALIGFLLDHASVHERLLLSELTPAFEFSGLLRFSQLFGRVFGAPSSQVLVSCPRWVVLCQKVPTIVFWFALSFVTADRVLFASSRCLRLPAVEYSVHGVSQDVFLCEAAAGDRGDGELFILTDFPSSTTNPMFFLFRFLRKFKGVLKPDRRCWNSESITRLLP